MSIHTTARSIGARRRRPPTRTRTSRDGHQLLARRFGLATAATIAAIPLVVASPIAAGAERVVHPGQSIQAAVDAARPGDTIRVAPGTYHESITIVTDRVTLVGAGPDTTHIRPPAEADNPCAAEGFGVCIFGQFDENFNLVRPVEGKDAVLVAQETDVARVEVRVERRIARVVCREIIEGRDARVGLSVIVPVEAFEVAPQPRVSVRR